MGFLDYAGLQYLWDKLKEKFAPKSHTHDDRYYTESEVDTKLGTKASSDHTHGLNSSSLAKTVDNVTTDSWDMIGGNKNFLLRSLRMQAKAPDWLEGHYAAGIAFGGSDTKGVISHAYSSPAIKFAGGNGAAPVWWLRLTGTSGKTYNLDSMPYATSAGSATNATTSKSLQLLSSARQTSMNFNLADSDYLGKITYQIASSSTTTGKPPVDSGVLNFSWDNSGWGAQVAVANSNNPRMYVRGAISNNGASKWDTSWKTVAFTDDTMTPKAHTHSFDSITGKPSTYPPSAHSHAYLPLGGGTMSGQIKRDVGCSWINDRDSAIVYGTSSGTGSGYHPVVGQKTPSGAWTIGTYSNENLIFDYTTDIDKKANNNKGAQVYLPAQAGTIITSATIGSQSVNYANTAGGVAWGDVSGKPSTYTPSAHTHTKSQITDFPTSLKNPTALTIQTNGTTAAIYDGSAAKSVNITKTNIGLGNVDNTADKDKTVASAAKLTTTRTVSGGSDITLDFKYDGSGNSTANIGFYSCKHSVGNTNNYPFHRFAKLDANKNAWVDHSMTFLISQDYSGGGYGVCRLVYRSNADAGNSTVFAQWLVRKGLSADTVQVAIKNDKTNGTYCDAFYKSSGTHMGATIRSIASGGRATLNRTWTLVNSNEVNGTTATDKKTSSECWKTIAEAGTALHKQAYSSSASATDEGYVATAGSANSAASCTGNSASATKLTSSAGSATQPVYFKDGKPVAGTYTLGDASSKMVRTLSARGNSGWANQATDDKYVPTMSFMAYWNGAYSSSGASNLQYCDRGRFGTIVTKNSGDYASASHTHSFDSITDKPSTYPPSAHNQSWSTITNKPALMESDGYHAETIEALLKKVQGLSPRMGSCSLSKDTYVANTWWNFIYIPHRTGSGDDNPDYGTLLFFPMVGTGSSYIIRAGKDASVKEVRKIYTSSDKPTKDDIGLGNVDNTADANKSVKYATSANYIKDVKNSKLTTFAYSKDGMNYADYTWLAGWNGYELRAVNKNQFATASAGVTASGSNYVRFGNGTQICWGITNCKGKEATASFAVAFNNTDYAVTIMGNYDSWADTYWITGSHTTTSFAIKASGSALAARPINWIAVGTWK